MITITDNKKGMETKQKHGLLGGHIIHIAKVWTAVIAAWATANPATAQLVLDKPRTGTFTDAVSITLKPGFHTTGFHAYITGILQPVPLGSAPSADRNYIRRRTYLKPYDAPPAAPKTDDVMEDITYYDGLGRQVQTVSTKAGPTYGDIVTHRSYDVYGRADRSYLPYSATAANNGSYKADAVTAQALFYNRGVENGVTTIPAAGGITPSFAGPVYEASPLNRVAEQGFPGAVWQPAASRTNTSGRTAVTEYGTNNAVAFGTVGTTRRAARYSVDYDQYGDPVLKINAPYGPGELHVRITKDENWIPADGRAGTRETYTDKQGRVVLERAFNRKGTATEMLSTYYVYDDFGNLCYVLPPGLAPDREASSPVPAAELAKCAYQYRFDMRQRLSQKKLPGSTYWQKMIYNAMDWIIIHQDGNTASNGELYHVFYKYDAMGRQVMKGTQRGGDLPWWQTQHDANGQAYPKHWEECSGAAGNVHGYTNRSMPVLPVATPAKYEVMEVNYYDRYSDIPGLPHNESGSYSAVVQGLLTAKKTRVIGETAETWLWTVYYYDALGRLAKEWGQHFRGGKVSGNTSTVVYSYSFAGQPVKTVQTLASTGQPTLTVTTEYSYDHRGRPVDTRKQVTSGTVAGAGVLAVRNGYNAIGQLRSKSLHSTDNGGSFRQQVSYGYNARGWLSSLSSPLFGQVLRYNDTPAGVTPQFNGNISRQEWSRNGTAAGSFSYGYDRLDRLTSGAAADGKRELVEYDAMGNISELTRDAGPKWVYGYDGNKLATIKFGTTNYTYAHSPATGNMTRDGRNGNNIAYNYLNLPQTITGTRAVSYTYGGGGEKLRTVNAGISREYVKGTEWTPQGLDFIHMEEGRIVRSGSTFSYEYFLKDHLGNARAGFLVKSDGTLDSRFRADYYPFGKDYGGVYPSPKNNYLYNGKELQEGIGSYDYGARQYDPVIGRWGVQDILAENHYDHTPYNYTLNNPLRYRDPLGLDTLDANNVKNQDWKTFNTKKDVMAMSEVTVTVSSNSNNNDRNSSDSFGEYFAKGEKHFNGGVGIASAAVSGYNKIPNDVKRHYAYKLSKKTGIKSGRIFQGAKGTTKGLGRILGKLGPVGTVATVGVIGYELGTDTWDAHTIVNGGLLIGTGVATVLGAPVVLGGIAVYGITDYFFDIGDAIDSHVGRNSNIWKGDE